ncbi:MAG: integrase family protein [Burkholderiales bacterium]
MVDSAQSAGSGEAAPTKFPFTRARVDGAACPAGKSQALYWDTEQPGLGLRVTASGARSFIFESRLGGRTVRVTIGPASMPLRATKDRRGRPLTTGADTEAARLAALVAQGIDPRVQRAERIAEQQAQRDTERVERARREVLALDAWAAYCEAHKPLPDANLLRGRGRRWGERHYAEHLRYADAGGRERTRAKAKATMPGPLRSLLDRPLADIDSKAVEAWAKREAATRAPTARLGFRMLAAFVRWCAESDAYRDIVQADACGTKRVREQLGRPGSKDDALQREQLAPWFREVRRLSPVVAAYLQCLLLTGARREELATLTWADVDFQWRTLRLRDKVEGERVIPLTPMVAQLLSFLPRRDGVSWVFTSPLAADGRLREPRIAHNRAVAAAGLPHLSLHGLRRSFGTLAEWVEVPAGVIAQVMGHKPSATAEKHYRVRPIDLLRLHHERIEAWMLEQAGLAQPKVEPPADRVAEPPAQGLRVVGGTAA